MLLLLMLVVPQVQHQVLQWAEEFLLVLFLLLPPQLVGEWL